MKPQKTARHYWWLCSFLVPFLCAFSFGTYLDWGRQVDGAQQSVDLGYAKEISNAEQLTFLKQAVPSGLDLGLKCGFAGLTLVAAIMLGTRKRVEPQP